MKVLDLFSGIGGFALGLERAGFETVQFCEIDPFCRAVLRKHWPEVPIHNDIRTFDGRGFAADVVCGGFPCQPFSQAGKRGGAGDDRALWPEMFRIIREVQPAYVIGENVIGLESLGLDDCCADLESIGYAVQTFDIPACGVGAFHRRHRLWIVAHSERDDAGRREPQHRAIERASGFVADGLGARRCGRRSVGQIRWPTEPALCGTTDGVPRRLDRTERLRSLGNSVVPTIPQIIGEAIMRAEHGRD